MGGQLRESDRIVCSCGLDNKHAFNTLHIYVPPLTESKVRTCQSDRCKGRHPCNAQEKDCYKDCGRLQGGMTTDIRVNPDTQYLVFVTSGGDPYIVEEQHEPPGAFPNNFNCKLHPGSGLNPCDTSYDDDA